MQVSTHDLITPAANKQHKIEDQLPEYFNHGRIRPGQDAKLIVFSFKK